MVPRRDAPGDQDQDQGPDDEQRPADLIGEIAREHGPEPAQAREACPVHRTPPSAHWSPRSDAVRRGRAGAIRGAMPGSVRPGSTARLDQDQVGVFQRRGRRGEARRRVPVRLVDPDAVAALDQIRLGDARRRIGQQPLVRLGGDRALVDRPLDRPPRLAGRRVGDQAALPDHGEAGAEDRHVLDDVGGQEDDPVLRPAPRAGGRTAGVPRDRARRSARRR